MKTVFYFLSCTFFLIANTLFAGLEEDLETFPHLIPIAKKAVSNKYKVDFQSVKPEEIEPLYRALDGDLSRRIDQTYETAAAINQKWDFNYQAINDERAQLEKYSNRLNQAWSKTFL